jgi:hypothetical protein
LTNAFSRLGPQRKNLYAMLAEAGGSED